jgi:hypothetical protein
MADAQCNAEYFDNQRQPAQPAAPPLDDARIGDELRRGFAPHRCVAEFQDRRCRVSLRIHALDGREFVVDGKRVDTLRDPDALAQYINDVRIHLMQCKVRFNAR